MTRALPIKFKTTTITHRVKDITGSVFGNLHVKSFAGIEDGTRKAFWNCACSCGAEKMILASSLLTGHSISCGCLHKAQFLRMVTKTGLSTTREGWSWRAMMTRCNNKNSHAYSGYGGRGIHVCKEWESLEQFVADMGLCPDGFTLERVDNNRGYEKSNCVWASRKDQTRNRRKTLVFSGKPIAAWSEELGLPYMTVYSRFKKTGSVFLSKDGKL